MRHIALLSLTTCLVVAGEAEEAGPWVYSARLGGFLQNVASRNADTSRDPAIAATSDSLAWTASAEGRLVWLSHPHRVEQRLTAEYGRIRTEGGDGWDENTDSIAYESTYERFLHAPHFVYANGTADTVFTGPEPDRRPADPLVAKLSSGYGQRYDGLLPIEDSLTWRAGVYARKRWEHGAADYQTEIDAGPELFVRYERKQSEDVSYHVQAEGYGEFDDAEHVTSVAQAGLRVRVTRLLSMEAKLRAYYESRPRQADGDAPGYDAWSLREEARIGLVWEIGGK